MQQQANELWARYRRALAGEPLPAALVDLDALEANVERLAAPARAAHKRIRVATKSLRCPALVKRVAALLGASFGGLMTYAAPECALWLDEGVDDLLLAYPTAQPRDVQLLAELARRGAVRVVADDVEQLDPLAAAAQAAGATVGVVLEIDLAYRVAGLHLGVRRSPLRALDDVRRLAGEVARRPGLRLDGVMGYEAQIAGLTDASPFHAWQNLPRRALKALSRGDVARARAAVVAALRADGHTLALVNGGGSGSLDWSVAEAALTEVAAGSGFLDSHLFDYYSHLKLEPAAYFALQVVRRPAPGMVACHGGGYIASGDGGADRLPLPSLPAGCRLVPMEGAGEVQTPLLVPAEPPLALGDSVFFRHAKAGELAEHFNEYLLVRGDSIHSRAPTYRGLGRAFLG